MTTRGIRLRADLWLRAEALAVRMAQDDRVRLALGGTVTPQSILRMALAAGVEQLEREAPPAPLTPPAPEAPAVGPEDLDEEVG